MVSTDKPDHVIFFKGDYKCETSYGLVTVKIPRDRTVADMKSALSSIWRGGTNGLQ